jgi:hypothetical protein
MNLTKRRCLIVLSPSHFWLNTLFLWVTIALLAFSLAGYAGELNHWIDLFSHFKVQYLLLSVIPLIFFSLKRHRLRLILSLCCILINGLEVAPWSPHYRRSLGKTRLHNTRLGFGILPSWSRVHPFFAISIDHILVSPEIGVKQTHVGRSVGSDHLPLISDLWVR